MKLNQAHFTKIPCHVTSSVVSVNTWNIMNVSFSKVQYVVELL